MPLEIQIKYVVICDKCQVEDETYSTAGVVTDETYRQAKEVFQYQGWHNIKQKWLCPGHKVIENA